MKFNLINFKFFTKNDKVTVDQNGQIVSKPNAEILDLTGEKSRFFVVPARKLAWVKKCSDSGESDTSDKLNKPLTPGTAIMVRKFAKQAVEEFRREDTQPKNVKMHEVNNFVLPGELMRAR